MSEQPKSVLIEQIEQAVLERNIAGILKDLNDNRYLDQAPARLIAVTKTVSPSVINQLRELGQIDIGENRAQVALPKLPYITPGFRLHWIGHLQSNKVHSVIDHVAMLHSLDRLSLAEQVNRCAGERGMSLPSLVQVNIAREPQKGGLPVEEVRPFLQEIRSWKGIHVMGLMSIMPIDADEAELRAFFKGMKTLYDQLRQEAIQGIDMQELSMGMSRDYRIAAGEGATMVRVGTALYRN